MYRALMTLTLAGVLVAGASALAQTPDNTQPDNTKVNKRDRQAAEPTADQQKENASDRELAKNVRRAIVKDKSLSSYAHNVKVIAQDGTVTLKGPVRSAEERKSIEDKATEVAGAGNVKNELSVKDDTVSKKN
jgi:hyperosmotically inducible periplasmic protein